MLVGCGSGAAETPAAEAPAAEGEAEAETPAAEEPAAEAPAASADGGKVYYLNFKPEVDTQWQEIAAAYPETCIETVLGTVVGIVIGNVSDCGYIISFHPKGCKLFFALFRNFGKNSKIQ